MKILEKNYKVGGREKIKVKISQFGIKTLLGFDCECFKVLLRILKVHPFDMEYHGTNSFYYFILYEFRKCLLTNHKHSCLNHFNNLLGS